MRHRLGRLLRRRVKAHLMIGLMHLGIGHHLIRPIGTRGRGQQHMLRRHRPRGLQNFKGPDQVRIDIRPRRVDGMAHPGLRREMDDGIGPERLDQPAYKARRLQQPFNPTEPRLRRQNLMPPPLQRHIIIVADAIQPQHLPACRQQPLRQMKPDKSGRTRDKCPTRQTLTSSRCPNIPRGSGGVKPPASARIRTASPDRVQGRSPVLSPSSSPPRGVP